MKKPAQYPFGRKAGILCCLISLASGSCLTAQVSTQPPVQPQASISGTVYGALGNEKEPLPFAHVRITGGEHGTAANAEGHFELAAIPAGTHTLLISSVGYQARRESITLEAGSQTTLNPVLTPSQALQTVSVTGSMRQTYLRDSPVKVAVISSEQMDTYLPSGGSNLVDNISLVNGVEEVVACGVCYTNSISINGLPGPYTAVLMDGMPLYGSLASVYGLNGLPNQVIERMEVIKGPSSTLYGSEAVAGVINIITRDPAKQEPFSIDAQGTTHGEAYLNLGLAPKLGNTSGFLGFNGAYANRFDDQNEDGFNDGVSMDRASVFTKWVFGRPSGRTWTLAAKGYYEDRRNGVAPYLANRAYRDLRGNDSIYGESILTKRAELFGTYEWNTTAPLRLDYAASWHDQQSWYGSDAYQAQQGTVQANLIWDQQYGEHALLAGLSLRGQYYDDNTAATESIESSATQNQPERLFTPGLFVQDEWEISPRVTLLGGLRLDRDQRHGLIWSPRLSAQVEAGTWTTLRWNIGSGFRSVNLFAEDHAFVTGQRELVIDPDLQPERSWAGAWNLHHIYSLGSASGSLDLDAFATYFTNKVITDYSVPNQIQYRNTDGHALSAGAGFTADIQLAAPCGMQLAGQVQQAVQRETDELGEPVYRPIELAPRWTAVLTANYRFRKADVTIALTGNATGSMTLPEVYDLDPSGQPLATPRSTRSKPFVRLNLQADKRVGERLAFYAGVQNLTNYRQPGSPLAGLGDPNNPAGFSPYFDTAYAYAPNHGREAYLGLRWSLARRDANNP